MVAENLMVPWDLDFVSENRIFVTERPGRLRSVEEGPDGFLYLTTSSIDGRVDPISTDDRVLRIETP